MIGCLSCNPEFIPSKPLPSSKFDSHQALLHLHKCSSNFHHLRQIHALIIRHHHPSLLTHLLHRSLSFQNLHYSTTLFHQIPNPPTFTWNLIIRAHATRPHQALLLYSLMLSRGAFPDKFTFPFVIKACSLSNSIHTGTQVHALAIKSGFYRDTFLHNNLIHFYCECGDWVCARKVFDKMPVRNVVSWTTLVAGLVSSGELETARDVFEGMPVRNVVSWTVMIDGYVKEGRVEEALGLFRRMRVDDGVMPNEFTLVSLLVGCTELGSLKLGAWIHEFANKNGFKLDAFLGTALIDMYSKCDSLEDAKRVFDSMEEKSVATWNSMITSLGVHGRGKEALALFARMEKANVVPDAITFVGVLCACVRTGLVEEGCRYFIDMKERYGIAPSLEHYGCMVELFGRAGLLDDSHESQSLAPRRPGSDILEAFLRASKEHSLAGLADSVGSDEHSDASVSHQCFINREVG